MAVGQTLGLRTVLNRDDVWILTRQASTHYMAYKAILHIAACWFDLKGCIGARLGKGIDNVSQHKRHRSVLWYWCDEFHKGDYLVLQPNNSVSLQALTGHRDYLRTRSVHFIMVDEPLVCQIQEPLPDLPMLG